MSVTTINDSITSESLPPVRDYVAYESGQFRMAMDLVRLDLAEWIEIDDQLPAELAERRRLLTEHIARFSHHYPKAMTARRKPLTFW